jgi:hypothetical protein
MAYSPFVLSEDSRASAAHSLGISRVTLYKKMKKYGLMNGSPKANHAQEANTLQNMKQKTTGFGNGVSIGCKHF